MELIALYAPDAADFSTLGLGALTPSECTVTWQAAGTYELTLVQPIDATNRWAQLANGCIISAPVPVRESPLYEYGVGDGGSGTVTRNIWQVARTTVGLYMRTGYGTSYKALRHYPNGTQVIELDRQTVNGRVWIHCTTVVGGETGYMSTKYLDLVETKTETIADGRPENQRVIQLTQSRRQLFRIYSTEQDSDVGVVTVKARHVFYDLTGNMLNGDYSPENVPGAEAVRQVFAQLKNAGGFSVYTEGLTKGSVTGEYGYKNPVEILLDPDDGIVSQCKSIEMIVGQVNQNAEDIANLDSLDIYTGNTPPAAPIAEGKLWIDTGVTPTVIRRWRGLDVSTEREYSIAGSAFSLSTIDAYFTISNGSGTSGWALSANSSAGVNLVPGNIGVNSSTATITLKAVRDLSSVVIRGAYYTETNFDKITLTVAGTTVLNAVSGTSASVQRYSGSIVAGQEIVLKYVKDVSNSATNEASTLFTITSSDTVPAGYTASGWDTISDTQEIERILSQVEQTAESAQDAASSAQNTAASAQDAAESAKSTADSALPRVEFQRVVRIDDEGLHVGDNQSNGEVLVDSNSVNVVFNGQKYSKFSGNYVQFGNYQLRRSSDGGLVFKLA